jgi:DNA-binding NtrC family response regulator
MKNFTILIAGESLLLQRDLEVLLDCHGFTVVKSPIIGSTLGTQNWSFDLIILCASKGCPGDGLELAQRIRKHDKKVPVIFIAEESSEELVIEALRTGINDYFKHPFSMETLVSSVRRCLYGATSEDPALLVRKTDPSFLGREELIGNSPSMRAIKAYIPKVAATDSNVLVTGETGTGKELAAELIHKRSARNRKPFVCVNCAAIPDQLAESELFGHERGAFTGALSLKEGKLKLADGGSIFFDEIGDMSPYAQAKVLRVIENKRVERLGGQKSLPLDVRVIAATNRDLEQMAENGGFRPDLYFRLNVGRIHLPALREHKEDIPLLLEHYLTEFNRRFGAHVEGFKEDVLDQMFHYNWPGNVRELRNLLEAIFVGGPSQRISLSDLPDQFRRNFDAMVKVPREERERLLSALSSTNWNKSKAAEKLHWSRMTLYRKIAKYQLYDSEDNLGERREPVPRH